MPAILAGAQLFEDVDVVQALSISAAVPTPLGEAFAADQFLTSEQNSAIFDLALLAPSLISAEPGENIPLAPSLASATDQMPEVTSGEASVEMPTGKTGAPANSALNFLLAATEASPDKDVALTLAALAALEQTSRSPLIAKQAKMELLPATLKTRFGSEPTPLRSIDINDVSSGTTLQIPIADFVSSVPTKWDDAVSNASPEEKDTAIAKKFATGVKPLDEIALSATDQYHIAPTTGADMSEELPPGTVDDNTILPRVIEPKQEEALNAAPLLMVQSRTETPTGTEPSILLEAAALSVVSNVSIAKPDLSNSVPVKSDFISKEIMTFVRDDYHITTIVDAPKDEQPAFIGELIETPEPISLPNRPVPNAPRLPLSDPSSYRDAPAFVFSVESIDLQEGDPTIQNVNDGDFPFAKSSVTEIQLVGTPTFNNHMRAMPAAAALAIQIPAVDTPAIIVPIHIPLELQKSANDDLAATNQDATPIQPELSSIVVEMSAGKDSKDADKTTENKGFSIFSGVGTLAHPHKKREDSFTLNIDIKDTSFDDGKASVAQNRSARDVQSNENNNLKGTPKDASEATNIAEAGFVMMTGLMTPQRPQSPPPESHTLITSEGANQTPKSSRAFDPRRAAPALHQELNAAWAPKAESPHAKETRSETQNRLIADDHAQMDAIISAPVVTDELVAKIESSTSDHIASTIKDDEANLDAVKQEPDQALFSHREEAFKHGSDAQQGSQDPLQHHKTPISVRSNSNAERGNDLANAFVNVTAADKSSEQGVPSAQMSHLVEDDQNESPKTESNLINEGLNTPHKSDDAGIREMTLVTKSVEQTVTNITHRPGLTHSHSTSESVSTSFAAPAAAREQSAAPAYVSSDNPLFQIQRDRALQSQIIAALKSGRDEVRLSLYPPQLGQVTINLALDGHKVKVGLKTSSREASDLLTTEQPSLSHALQREGFTLEGFDVTEDDTHNHRKASKDQTKTSPIPESSGSSEFSIDITI